MSQIADRTMLIRNYRLSLILFAVLAGCKPTSTAPQPASSRNSPVSGLHTNPKSVITATASKKMEGDRRATPPPTHTPWILRLADFSPPNIPDALWFHGWDPKGVVFAWERRQESAGADCDLRHVFYAVDASSDSFVQDGLLTVAHESPEANSQGLCVPESLVAKVAASRTAFLRRHNIQSMGAAPVRVKPSKGGFEVTDPRGELAFDFEVLQRSTDPYGPRVDKGAAYRLVLRSSAARDSVVIEDGKRRRPNVMDYRLGEARWFPAPQGDYGALILQRVERGFEGAHLTWMSNGVRVRRRP